MRIGVYGGTFNPIHKSHIYVVEQFYKKAGLEKILIIPTAVPPHKQVADLASGQDRLNMCRLATNNLTYVEVADYEVKQGDKSYTYLTLEWIKALYPESELFLLMGSDMFLTLETWKHPEKIYPLADICVIRRGWAEDHLVVKQQELLRKKGACTKLLEVDAKPMSSTEIRERIKTGQPVEQYLDCKVIEYIEEHGLYGEMLDGKL